MTPPAAGSPPPAAPAAPTAPPTDPRTAFFAPSPAAPPAPDPNKPAEPPARDDFDAEAFAKNFIKEILPDDFVKSEDPRHRTVAGVREQLAKATARATAAELKFARANKGTGSAAETMLRDKLTALEAELGEAKPRLERITTLEARAELLDNDAFGKAYIDQLEALKTEARDIAKEAGVDVAVIEKAFAAEGKLAAAKALADVEDDDAKQLLRGLVNDALAISTKFKSEWKDPLKAVAHWRVENAKAGMQRSIANTQQAVALHRKAVQDALAGDPANDVPENVALLMMLQTPQGKAEVDAIEASWANNTPATPDQLIADRVRSATVPHLLRYIAFLELENATAKGQVQGLVGMAPTGYGSPGALAGAAAPASTAPSKFWSPGGATQIGPVVTGATRVAG